VNDSKEFSVKLLGEIKKLILSINIGPEKTDEKLEDLIKKLSIFENCESYENVACSKMYELSKAYSGRADKCSQILLGFVKNQYALHLNHYISSAKDTIN
jgi:hypothetical protein